MAAMFFYWRSGDQNYDYKILGTNISVLDDLIDNKISSLNY